MAATIGETNFELPGQVGEVYHGKVADTYTIEHEAGELLVVIRTDRVSAFNAILPRLIPHKGHVLNEMSAEMLAETRDVAPNWFLEAPDPNVTIGRKLQPLGVEMIIRAGLLGSSWGPYQKGNKNKCGNLLPEGMKEYGLFPEPIITPTRKSKDDEDITPSEIIAAGLATRAQYDQMAWITRCLHKAGDAYARKRGYLLADTKFEFGVDQEGNVKVIDEALTPDSSRHYVYDEYIAYLDGQREEPPTQQSKEFVRAWLKRNGFEGKEGQTIPEITDELVDEFSTLYQGLYSRMLGRPFVPATETTEADMQERIRENIVRSLGNLAAA